MENPEESKSSAITENETSTTEAPKPLPRKKSPKKAPVPRKRSNSISKDDDSKLKLLASDGRIPGEAVSQMASKMIDTVLHNCEPSKPNVNASVSSTEKKKSKPSVPKIEVAGDKENVNRPQSIQKLTKLTDCLECQWRHNYHPCLLSNSKDNTKCKDEMKRKGFQYEEPKQCCLLNKEKPQETPAVKVTPSSKSVKKQPASNQQQLKQNPSSKLLPTKSENVAEDGKKPKVTPSKQIQSSSTFASRPKTTPSKQNQSQSTVSLKPKTAPSSKALKASPSTKKPIHVNFESEKNVAKSCDTQASNKQSKVAVTAQSSVRPTSSRIGKEALDLLNKLTSKSSHAYKTVKSKKTNRLVVSVPVSTRESRTRFNLRQPSPSAIHLPPEVISAHELRCKTFDPVTTECICESAVSAAAPAAAVAACKPKKSAKAKTAKKGNEEVNELIAEGKPAACDWEKNYHPCDKPKKKCDKSGDQQLCKVWKKGKSETDPLKSTKGSCKSVTDPNSTLSTTPSEKAYIDKVVRTAVKLAKQNVNGNNCKRPRKRMKNGYESGIISSSMATTAASSALMQVNTMVENAIGVAVNQVPVKRNKKSKKLAPCPVVSAVESSQKKNEP